MKASNMANLYLCKAEWRKKHIFLLFTAVAIGLIFFINNHGWPGGVIGQKNFQIFSIFFLIKKIKFPLSEF